MPAISFYKNAKDTVSTDSLELDDFLRFIKEGKWQDFVLPIRTIKDKELRDNAKRRVPCVTIAGLFTERKDASIKKHSGYIAIDIDTVPDLNETKSFLYTDDYLHAGFDSISGYGLCCVFRINPKKHREAFAGLCEYLFKKYNIVCDPTSINESRARFVSYDPNMYYRHNPPVFEIYPEKPVPLKKIPTVIFAQNDFENIISQIQKRNIDITEDYQTWLRLGFALVSKFGEGGRQYFHQISQISQKYHQDTCDRQYTACSKSNKSGVSIGTFYYYAKMAGVETVSKETKIAIQTAQTVRKSGRDKDQAEEILKKEGIKAPGILEQVFDYGVTSGTDDALIVRVQLYLRQSYSMRRNVITRKIEVDGKYLDDSIFNDIWCDAVKIFDKVTSEMVQRLINSSFTVCYNPFLDFFGKFSMRNPQGAIDKIFDSIASESFEYTRYFGKKWIVSIVASAHGQHSPLMFVLSGPVQGTGKTEWFRRLLPADLQSYYAESKLDAGKDDEILMTQKLLIMDDEMGGKSKKDELKIKELLSRQTFTLREPYGRYNIDLTRVAVLCGTTNEEAILSDPTGNRRIIPVPVYGINHDTYNEVDKVDVFIEAYHLYKSGFDWQLTRQDVQLLADKTGRFEKYTSEYELITKHFKIPESDQAAEFMTATEIKNYLETHSVQKLIPDSIGKALRKLGFVQSIKKVNGSTNRLYSVQKMVTGDSKSF